MSTDDRMIRLNQVESTEDIHGYTYSYIVRQGNSSGAYVGLNGGRGDSSVSIELTLDDAEAIGYSLLYAVKLQRDAAKETEERE